MDLLIFGLSHHFNEPRPEEEVAEYREFNPGLGLQERWDGGSIEITVTGAAYRNSLDKPSLAFGPGFRTKGNYGIEASGMLITGYFDIPVLVPVGGVYYTQGPITLHLGYMQAAAVFYIGVKL